MMPYTAHTCPLPGIADQVWCPYDRTLLWPPPVPTPDSHAPSRPGPAARAPLSCGHVVRAFPPPALAPAGSPTRNAAPFGSWLLRSWCHVPSLAMPYMAISSKGAASCQMPSHHPLPMSSKKTYPAYFICSCIISPPKHDMLERDFAHFSA